MPASRNGCRGPARGTRASPATRTSGCPTNDEGGAWRRAGYGRPPKEDGSPERDLSPSGARRGNAEPAPGRSSSRHRPSGCREHRPPAENGVNSTENGVNSTENGVNSTENGVNSTLYI